MHPLAHTLSHGFALENGGDQGTIIKTHDAYVFCGFRQDDGGIQFKTMMQYEGNTHEMLESQGLMKTSEPVFMTEDEMQKTGVAAIVFPTTNDAFNFSQLSNEITKHCTLYSAKKDIELNGDAPLPDYARDGFTAVGGARFENNTRYGLASHETVTDAVADMPMSFSSSFARAVQDMFGMDVAPSNVQPEQRAAP
jgi:hypothetical protein